MLAGWTALLAASTLKTTGPVYCSPGMGYCCTGLLLPYYWPNHCQYSVCLLTQGWPDWVGQKDGLLAQRQSPILLLTRLSREQS